MKNLMLMTGFVLAMNAYSSIEYIPEDHAAPDAARVEASRSCFRELTSLGCGDPGEDHEHFRSCMNNVYGSLTTDCKALMKKLYGKT